MTRRSLLTLFLIAIGFVCIQLFLRPFLKGSPLISQLILIFYSWIPGVIALVFSRLEKVKFSIFSRPNKCFFLIPVITMGICLSAFLLTIPFGATKIPNPVFVDQNLIKAIGYGVLFLFTSYLFATIFFGVVFLGGELYWRGYLWEKWKKAGPFRAIWIIALIWSLWQLPIMIFSYSSRLHILYFLGVIFILSPVLTYFRVRGRSVLAAAVFYSSLMGSFLYFVILFPISQLRIMEIYLGWIMVGLFLYSLFLKLYSPSFWKKIV